MISIEQVLLLQQKVESAVAKIAQLKAENDALRTKCSELTNALSEKTELLFSFEADEKRIEDGILQALDKLNSVENSLLNSASQVLENQVDLTEENQTLTSETIEDNDFSQVQAESGTEIVPQLVETSTEVQGMLHENVQVSETDDFPTPQVDSIQQESGSGNQPLQVQDNIQPSFDTTPPNAQLDIF